jgi:hypothetical protein
MAIFIWRHYFVGHCKLALLLDGILQGSAEAN